MKIEQRRTKKISISHNCMCKRNYAPVTGSEINPILLLLIIISTGTWFLKFRITYHLPLPPPPPSGDVFFKYTSITLLTKSVSLAWNSHTISTMKCHDKHYDEVSSQTLRWSVITNKVKLFRDVKRLRDLRFKLDLHVPVCLSGKEFGWNAVPFRRIGVVALS